MNTARTTRLAAAICAGALTIAAGCGDDGGEPSIPQSGERETTTTTTATTTTAGETTSTAGETTSTTAPADGEAPQGGDGTTTTVAGG